MAARAVAKRRINCSEFVSHQCSARTSADVAPQQPRATQNNETFAIARQRKKNDCMTPSRDVPVPRGSSLAGAKQGEGGPLLATARPVRKMPFPDQRLAENFTIEPRHSL